MAPISLRVRHPTGVATIQVLLDKDFSILDFQQEIYAVTSIPPERQILKSGYPPRPLVLEPQLPLQSLGVRQGDQIIVSEGDAPPAPPPVARPTAASVAPAPAQSSSRPSAAAAPEPPVTSASPSGPDSVELDGSFLIHRIVPDDNSCLFSSAAIVFKQDISYASQMRKVVVEGIKKDPETYNEAILGMPPAQYITTISKPTSWGGAIELSVLSKHYGVEIASIDVESGRIDRYTPPPEPGVAAPHMRCVLIYSGIHYDAATLAPMPDAPNEWHQTQFPIVPSESDDKDPVLVAAKKLATILRQKKAFTNTSTFDLKCEQCGQGLKGEKGARAHAEETGHVRFGEY